MLVSQHNIKVVPKIFGYNLFILEKSILYITARKKTDKIDAKILADLVRTKYLPAVWIPDEKTLSELAKEDPDIKNLVTIYRSLKNEEKDVMKRIQLHARTMKETTLLMSTPGIAEFSSLMILAEIGDIKRFPSPKQLVNYADLCCGIYQTGSTERSARNTAVNKWLKWIIYECSGRAIMLDPKFQEFFYRINQRKGYNTARKMLTIL